MQLKDMITLKAEPVAPETWLSEIARRLLQSRMGVAPVCDHGRLVGVLTTHDLFLRVSSFGSGSDPVPISEVMDRDFVSGYDDEDAPSALMRMRRAGRRYLFVVDHNGLYVGVVEEKRYATGSADL